MPTPQIFFARAARVIPHMDHAGWKRRVDLDRFAARRRKTADRNRCRRVRDEPRRGRTARAHCVPAQAVAPAEVVEVRRHARLRPSRRRSTCRGRLEEGGTGNHRSAIETIPSAGCAFRHIAPRRAGFVENSSVHGECPGPARSSCGVARISCCVWQGSDGFVTLGTPGAATPETFPTKE